MARIKIIDTFASRMALPCSSRLASLSFSGAVTPSRPCIIMTAPEDKPIQIDLAAIVRQRLGSKARFVPRMLVRKLERTICQEDLNRLLRDNFPRRGADFCRGVFHDLGVTVNVKDENLLPPPSQRRVIICSNHPLGGLDGMALIDFFQRRYGGNVYFLVNDLLMAVEPLSDVFLPINKHGSQSRDSIRRIDEVLEGNDPVLIFPAGLCSRRGPGKNIRDLDWKKMFVVKAIQYQRDIIPVYFDGRNSDFFYNFARWRKRSGLKFNVEMIYLPREVFRSKGKTFTIHCLPPIPWQQLGLVAKASETAQNIKQRVYDAAACTSPYSR